MWRMFWITSCFCLDGSIWHLKCSFLCVMDSREGSLGTLDQNSILSIYSPKPKAVPWRWSISNAMELASGYVSWIPTDEENTRKMLTWVAFACPLIWLPSQRSVSTVPWAMHSSVIRTDVSLKWDQNSWLLSLWYSHPFLQTPREIINIGVFKAAKPAVLWAHSTRHCMVQPGQFAIRMASKIL